MNLSFALQALGNAGLFYIWTMWRVMTFRPAVTFSHLNTRRWHVPVFMGLGALMCGLRWQNPEAPAMGIAAMFLIQFGLLAGFGPRCLRLVLAYSTGSVFLDAIGILLPGGSVDGPLRTTLSMLELSMFLFLTFELFWRRKTATP